MRRVGILGGCVLVALATGAATPAARQVYAPLWTTTLNEMGPCLLAVALPASRAERCIPWTRREVASPAFHESLGLLVVGGGGDGALLGIDARNGDVAWRQISKGPVAGKPVLVDDAGYAATLDGHVFRFDVTSGSTRWDVAVDAEVTEPVVVDGDLVIAVTGADSVYAFSAKDGAAAWVHKHPLPRGITLRGQARPLVATVNTPDGRKARVYVGHASGRLTVLDRDTGTVVQELDLSQDDGFGDVDADPVIVGGTLLAVSQTRGVYALDPSTLTERWRLDESGLVRMTDAGHYLAVAAGAGKVLGIDTRVGKVLWRFTYEKGAPTRVAVKGGRVHVASDRGPLYVLDLFSGQPLQYAGSPLGIAGDLELSGDMLFAVTTAGELLAMSNAFRGLVQQQQHQKPQRKQ